MSEAPTSAVRVFLIAITAVAGAAGAWVGLLKLAQPADFQARRTALQEQLERAEHLARAGAPESRFQAQAVCPGLSDAEMAGLQQKLMTMAGQAGVTLTDLVAVPGPTKGRLAPVGMRLQGEGAYDAVMRLLADLAQTQPEIFVESLDLSSKSPNVTLKLSAKVFCWASRGS